MTTRIDETQAAKALREVQRRSAHRWQQDGYHCNLSEYEDAGLTAIAGCLARYDPTRGVQFHTYAAARISGNIRDAAQTYRV